MARMLVSDGKGGTKIVNIGVGYSGPVPKGYSQEIYSKTGRTVKEGARSGGGGGSSGGGGSGSPPPTPTPSPSVNIQDEIKKREIERVKNIQTQQELRNQYQSKIRVQGRGVQTGGRKYYGGIIVPGTGGKTANQIQQETFKSAREKYGSGTKRGGYTATYDKDYFSGQTKEEIKTTTPTSNTQIISNPFQSGGVYNPQTRVFETTPSPYGQYGQGTINILSSRLPTPEEQLKIDDPLKYAQQKFREKYNISQEGLIESNPNLNRTGNVLNQIFPPGNKTLPYGLEPKTTEQAQEKFNIFYTGDYLGRKVSDALPNQTRQNINQYFNESQLGQTILTKAYEGTRELPKFIFFSPAMVTGASAKAEAVVEEESISEALSKNRFEGLGEGLKKLEKKMASKSAGKEQTKYLSDLYKNLKTTQEKENFRDWVVSLYEKNVFKGIDMKYYQSSPIKVSSSDSGIYVMTRNLPKMDRVDVVGSGSSIVGNKNEIVIHPQRSLIDLGQGKIQTNVLGLRMETTQKTGQRGGLSLGLRTQQKQRTQQKEKQINLLKEKLKTKQEIKQRLQYGQVNLLREELKYKQKLITEQELITKLKEREKIKVPKRLKLLIEGFKASKRKGPIDEETFKIFKKIKGEFMEIGKEKSFSKAERELKSSLLKDLSASGFIEKGGMKVQAIKYSDRLFRPSKRSPGILVQRSEKGLRGGRLTSFGEIREIQKARKKSSSTKPKRNKKIKWI